MRIEDYALIGDCHTAALVGRNGSIDWLCWPRFDSAACFAALLGKPENGFWKIGPAGSALPGTQKYRPDTLILETDFETADGAVTLIDFGRLLGIANGVGLLAEEYDPVERRQLGNFPQAFSHVALVNTAMNLGEREKPAEQRAEKKAA